jgi:probable rRNA maturation factor
MNVSVCNRQRLLKVDTGLLKKIAQHTLTLVGAANDSLSIVLVGDKAIATLNRQYHHTDGPTDVLSFNYGDETGELIISVEHARSQSKRFRSTPARELILYVIHGVLHLHGYNDFTPHQRLRMRRAERRLLTQIRRRFDLRPLLQPIQRQRV